jgi:hypothetical protein
VTTEGRQFTGIKATDNNREVVLSNPAQSEPIRIARTEIEEIIDSPVSLMPANLVQLLKDRREFNDLLRYVLETRGSMGVTQQTD